MQVQDLDRHESGNFPIRNAVRWLKTLLQSPVVRWDDQQHKAATQAVEEAEVVLAQELSPNVHADRLFPPVNALQLEEIERDLRALYARLMAGKIYIDYDAEDVRLMGALGRLLNQGSLVGEVPIFQAYQECLAVLADIQIRIAFMGWPAEPYWKNDTATLPTWVPDWRRECAAIQAVRFGSPPRLERTRPFDALPYNQIPVEERPAHVGQGRVQLTDLHRAWLSTQDDLVEGTRTHPEAAQRFYEYASKHFAPKRHAPEPKA